MYPSTHPVPKSLPPLTDARTYRALAQVSEAEAAFEEVRILAARLGEWESLYHGFAGVGRLHINRGEYDEACPWYEEAHKVAKMGNLRKWLAPSLHDLFRCAVLKGDEDRGMRIAATAMDLYVDQKHPRLFALIHDLCYFQLIRGETHTNLSSVFTTPQAYSLAPDEQVLTRGNLLHALGREDRQSRFETELNTFDKLLQTLPDNDGEGSALALIGAARGTLQLKRPSQAVVLLGRALEVAQKRDELKLVREARALLSSISGECSPTLHS